MSGSPNCFSVFIHLGAVPKLRQPVPVKYQGIFRRPDNPHIRFQNLRTVVFAEYQRYVVYKSMLGSRIDKRLDLLKRAKHNHAWAVATPTSGNRPFIFLFEHF